MAPVTNGRLLFNDFPTGYPEPGKTTIYDETETIDLDNVPLNGGILVKTLNLSIDPYLRNRMKTTTANPFKIGAPIVNRGIALVLRSENDKIKPGDHVFGFLNFQEYNVLPHGHVLRVLKNEHNLPWTVYTGVAGMPGQTAYNAWKEFAQPKPGDIVFVSTAAGPVGSIVVQLAKADGLKVIGSTGSDEKVEFIKSIGADVAFNYKTQDTAEVLKKEGPINIYWDNVGGSTLDAALGQAATGARFIECGMISVYNSAPPPLFNLVNVIHREITFHGFTVGSLSHKYEEKFYEEIPRKIASGEIKYIEDVTHGLKFAGHALEAVQRGTNKGKSVVIVAEE